MNEQTDSDAHAVLSILRVSQERVPALPSSPSSPAPPPHASHRGAPVGNKISKITHMEGNH